MSIFSKLYNNPNTVSDIKRMAHEDDGSHSPRERLQTYICEWRQLYRKEIEEVADEMVVARLNGPHTHKYKGVAVTEEQFWQFMKLEGFERPQEVI